MNTSPEVDEVIERLADGEPIDWGAAHESAGGPDDLEILRQLRILEQLGQIHRSASLLPAGETVTGPPMDARHRGSKSDLPPGGQQWGRYRLVRRIGEGSYGSVYLARDDELDRDLAIKLLHPSTALGDDLLRRVRSEGKALARVRHPNVVTVYDIEDHGGQLGLCMEYIPGRTLQERVRLEGPLSAGEAVPIAQDVCRALAAVHAAGLLHRDVKARNVMRENAGRIVLMDLGAGLELATAADATGATGTPIYMAPEALEDATATPQSDIYGVGVLLYFLVSGTYPVTGTTVDDIRDAHRRGWRVPLDERRLDLPESFLRVVARATAPDPAARYESAQAMLRDLGSDREGVAEPTDTRGALKRKAAVVGEIAGGLVFLAIASGLLTTWAFNTVVDRPSPFDPDSFIAKMGMGARSMVGPAVGMAVVLVVGAALQLGLRLIPGARRLWRSLLERASARTAEQERAGFLGQLLLVAGIAGLALVYFVYGDVFYSFSKSLSSDEPRFFSALRPENRSSRLFYRWSMAALLLLLVIGWLRVTRLRARTGGSVPAWVWAAAIGLMVLMIALSQAPYKLMFHNEVPVVLLDRQRCYELGRSGSEACMYCPAWDVPRVRSIQTAEHTIEPCGFDENVFLLTPMAGCAPGDKP